jgi:hypothetical protein
MKSTPRTLKASLLKLTLLVGAVAWLLAAPVVILAIGFSGGDLINPLALIQDLVSMDRYALDRIFYAWFVIYPFVAVYFLFFRPRHKDGGRTE